jgi:hypothetical protein
MPRGKAGVSILGLMFFVAVTATGLALTRYVSDPRMLSGYSPQNFMLEEDWATVPVLSQAYLDWGANILHFRWVFIFPLVSTWTVALAGWQLRGPGRTRARLSRRPGLVACVAATAGIAFAIVRLIDGHLAKNLADSPHAGILTAVGTAVAGAWFVLAVSGRWRAERGWADRAGRLLGAAWIAMGPALELVRIAAIGW